MSLDSLINSALNVEFVYVILSGICTHIKNEDDSIRGSTGINSVEINSDYDIKSSYNI